jgi:hypothetical protein
MPEPIMFPTTKAVHIHKPKLRREPEAGSLLALGSAATGCLLLIIRVRRFWPDQYELPAGAGEQPGTWSNLAPIAWLAPKTGLAAGPKTNAEPSHERKPRREARRHQNFTRVPAVIT